MCGSHANCTLDLWWDAARRKETIPGITGYLIRGVGVMKIQEQQEFPFVKDLVSQEEELEEDLINEFIALMNKYSVSDEDADRIALVAKFF